MMGIIRNSSNMILDLLKMVDSFFSYYYQIYENFLKTKKIFFTNEVLELLIYSENIELIIQILFCIVNNEPILEKNIYNVNLSNRYILPYMESFFFHHNYILFSFSSEGNCNPFYSDFVKFSEFETKYFQKEMDQFFKDLIWN